MNRHERLLEIANRMEDLEKVYCGGLCASKQPCFKCTLQMWTIAKNQIEANER